MKNYIKCFVKSTMLKIAIVVLTLLMMVFPNFISFIAFVFFGIIFGTMSIAYLILFVVEALNDA